MAFPLALNHILLMTTIPSENRVKRWVESCVQNGATEQFFTICKLPLFRFDSFTFIARIESEVVQQVFFCLFVVVFFLSAEVV